MPGEVAPLGEGTAEVREDPALSRRWQHMTSRGPLQPRFICDPWRCVPNRRSPNPHNWIQRALSSKETGPTHGAALLQSGY